MAIEAILRAILKGAALMLPAPFNQPFQNMLNIWDTLAGSSNEPSEGQIRHDKEKSEEVEAELLRKQSSDAKEKSYEIKIIEEKKELQLQAEKEHALWERLEKVKADRIEKRKQAEIEGIKNLFSRNLPSFTKLGELSGDLIQKYYTDKVNKVKNWNAEIRNEYDKAKNDWTLGANLTKEAVMEAAAQEMLADEFKQELFEHIDSVRFPSTEVEKVEANTDDDIEVIDLQPSDYEIIDAESLPDKVEFLEAAREDPELLLPAIIDSANNQMMYLSELADASNRQMILLGKVAEGINSEVEKITEEIDAEKEQQLIIKEAQDIQEENQFNILLNTLGTAISESVDTSMEGMRELWAKGSQFQVKVAEETFDRLEELRLLTLKGFEGNFDIAASEKSGDLIIHEDMSTIAQSSAETDNATSELISTVGDQVSTINEEVIDLAEQQAEAVEILSNPDEEKRLKLAEAYQEKIDNKITEIENTPYEPSSVMENVASIGSSIMGMGILLQQLLGGKGLMTRLQEFVVSNNVGGWMSGGIAKFIGKFRGNKFLNFGDDEAGTKMKVPPANPEVSARQEEAARGQNRQ